MPIPDFASLNPGYACYGDRAASVTDPSGNHWYLATHEEDVGTADPEEAGVSDVKKARRRRPACISAPRDRRSQLGRAQQWPLRLD